jgi:ATP-binding cassette subfamily B (MDR/TAP) protein 1
MATQPGGKMGMGKSKEAKISDVESGNSGNVDEDIVAAAKASNAHDFIMSFTDGYNTEVGEGSIMVSGGQKQRIAIARALVKKPAVLLLDEATSALDAASERVVQESIDALQQAHAQTTIVIAHRLSTIRNADKIAVIDKGQVVEIGNHDQLIAKGGLYKQLWDKQSGMPRGNSSKGNLAELAASAAASE